MNAELLLQGGLPEVLTGILTAFSQDLYGKYKKTLDNANLGDIQNELELLLNLIEDCLLYDKGATSSF